MKPIQLGLFSLSLIFGSAVSPFAWAGLWDNLRVGTIPIPISAVQLSGSADVVATCSDPGNNAPQEMLADVCARIVACMPGEDPNATRVQCLLRLTGEEGKELWKALLATSQDDPPTVTTLSNWLRTEKAQTDTQKFCACSAALPELSCEAIQSRFNATDYSWVGEVIESNAACDDVFSGPIAKADFDLNGAIHVFARCLDEQNQGKVCHWMAPPGGNLWGNNYWFHQLQMRADRPISVDYHHPSKTLNMVAYAKDGGDLGGAGSVHAMHCDADRFDQRASMCGLDNKYFSDKVHYNPSIVTSGRENPSFPNTTRSFIFFNSGKELAHFLWVGMEPGQADVRPSGEYLESGGCGQIDYSPAILAYETERTEFWTEEFAVGGGNSLVHTWVDPEGLGASAIKCKTYEASGANSPLTSSPKAIFGPNGKREVFALGENYRPYRWVIGEDNNSITSERLVDIQASMKVDNWLGVVVTPNDQKTHVFFRKHGPGTVVHAFKSSNNPTWSVLYPNGIDATAVLDSPAAVTDAEGNLHLFAGEWGGPNSEKAGSGRAYLHHFVKAAGASNWQSETLLLGNVQHTDQGPSAPTAIFIGPDGNTTQRNRTVGSSTASGSSPTGSADLGTADIGHCKEGYLYQETAYCGDLVGTSDRGIEVTEAWACNWPRQFTQETAVAAGRCPSHLTYIEYGRDSFGCQGTCTADVDRCPSGYAGGCYGGSTTTGMYYCSIAGADTSLCAGGGLRSTSRSRAVAGAWQECCIR